MAKDLNAKFEFDPEYQEILLRYTAQDKHGYKALHLYEDTYFTLLEHQTAAYLLKKYYQKHRRTPGDKGFLKEFLRVARKTDKAISQLSEPEIKELNKLIDRMYTLPVKDPDQVLQSIGSFKAYVELKHVLGTVDLKDFSQYESFSSRVNKAIRIAKIKTDEGGVNLLADVQTRQVQRKLSGDIVPTPFKQWDKWTNSGEGYNRGSVITLIGPSKRFKTAVLINIAKGYLKKRKKVLYVDLENGALSLAIRGEQALANVTKKDILAGSEDLKIRKLFRKYSRLGGELHIVRMPPYSTTADSIRAYKRERFKEFGEDYNVLIIDYGALLGSISGKKDEFERISDAYVDIKTLAEEEFDICYTANHVTREAAKHFRTSYEAKDIAKCIDIPRHIDALIGLNQTEEEEQAGVLRAQIVEQRDGAQQGSSYFWFKVENQYLKEFHKSEIEKYRQQLGGEQEPALDQKVIKKRTKNEDI